MNTRLGNILEEMKAGSRAAMLFQIGWPLWWPGWKAELREQVCDNDIALSSKGALIQHSRNRRKLYKHSDQQWMGWG